MVEGDEYVFRVVEFGVLDGYYIEVISGFEVGECVVVFNSYIIKVDLEKLEVGYDY